MPGRSRCSTAPCRSPVTQIVHQSLNSPAIHAQEHRTVECAHGILISQLSQKG
uniref:Uncharacterized protein n=1 Tax=Arundo donax TaxID=35708 RepID=A0A0A9D3U7_ARUDO